MLDTAIKTADAGYLTRRLVESAQEVVIKEYTCGGKNYMQYNSHIDYKGDVKRPLSSLLDSKFLVKNIIDLKTKKILEFKNNYITYKTLNKLEDTTPIYLSSIKLCLLNRSFCSTCFGMSTFKQNYIGRSVGIIAGQSIGEPGTQLTLRTFHTGGVSQQIKKNKYNTPNNLVINFNNYTKLLKYKICSNICLKKSNKFKKYISHLIYLKKNKIYYFLNSYKNTKLICLNDKIVYLKENKNIYNLIWSKSHINKLYQRNKTNNNTVSSTIGQLIFKQNIQLLIQNNCKVWELLNLNKSVVFNMYYHVLNIYNKYNLILKYSKNNRIVTLYTIHKSTHNLFSFKLLKNYMELNNILYIYDIIFSLNRYYIIKNNTEKLSKGKEKKIEIFKTNIYKFTNNMYVL